MTTIPPATCVSVPPQFTRSHSRLVAATSIQREFAALSGADLDAFDAAMIADKVDAAAAAPLLACGFDLDACRRILRDLWTDELTWHCRPAVPAAPGPA